MHLLLMMMRKIIRLPHNFADPGQTNNTSVMLQHLLASQPSLVMLAGDFTYADTWLNPQQHVPEEVQGRYSCECKHLQ
jgi:hypothetical protein